MIVPFIPDQMVKAIFDNLISFEQYIAQLVLKRDGLEFTGGDALVKAMAGRTNKPELIIAPAATANASRKPSCFFKCAKTKTPLFRRLFRSSEHVFTMEL